MGQHNLGLHHAHLQKRAELGQEYPSDDKQRRLFDKIILVGAFVGPVFTLPQAFKVFVEKDASGLSIISWTAYFVAALAWLYYGKLHKEKPIIISNILWAVLDLAIVVGIILYGGATY